MLLHGTVVSAVTWHSPGQEIDPAWGGGIMLSTKHSMKWLLSIYGCSDVVMRGRGSLAVVLVNTYVVSGLKPMYLYLLCFIFCSF